MQTATQGAVFIPEMWAKEIEKERTDSLVFANLVDRKFESQLQVGDTLHIPFLKEGAAEDFTPGSSITFAPTVEDEILFPINKYKVAHRQIQDILTTQSKYELRSPYTGVISRALAKAVDTDIALLHADVKTANIMAAIPAITFDAIVDANVLLDKANVPKEDRALVVDAVGAGDLRKIDKFTTFHETGSKNVVSTQKGYIGTIYGTPVYETNNIDTTGKVAHYMLVQKSAIGLIMQKSPKIEHARDIDTLSDKIVGSEIYGVKVIRPDHAVVIKRTL